MIFQKTSLPGVFVIEPECITDDRGFFARTWCQQEFREHGIGSKIVQAAVSFNRLRGTLRGMHYQAAPHEEEKLVRVTAGAIYDVALDLRPDSATFKQWFAVELTAVNRRSVYLPAGIAHGFQTLVDETEVTYQLSAHYAPQAARGVRHDDPTFAISWPIPPTVVSARDREFPNFGQ